MDITFYTWHRIFSYLIPSEIIGELGPDKNPSRIGTEAMREILPPCLDLLYCARRRTGVARGTGQGFGHGDWRPEGTAVPRHRAWSKCVVNESVSTISWWTAPHHNNLAALLSIQLTSKQIYMCNTNFLFSFKYYVLLASFLFLFHGFEDHYVRSSLWITATLVIEERFLLSLHVNQIFLSLRNRCFHLAPVLSLFQPTRNVISTSWTFKLHVYEFTSTTQLSFFLSSKISSFLLNLYLNFTFLKSITFQTFFR